MKKYIESAEWEIVEDGFHPEENTLYESIMSIGNGHMGIRGNFEEEFSGNSLKGTYIAGVYYPDKTRVGWWKNGYPEYFAKVLNAANFIGINLSINCENIDLAKVRIRDFKRILNMRQGFLSRSFIIIDSENRETKIETKRFFSIVNSDLAAISYSITPINHSCEIQFTPFINGDVHNADSNYDEKFWEEMERYVDPDLAYLTLKTKKLDFYVTTAMKCELYQNSKIDNSNAESIHYDKYVGNIISISSPENVKTTLYKYICVNTNRDYKVKDLKGICISSLEIAYDKGFDVLFNEHSKAWADVWTQSDITINGDVEAQQGIRFNIFQLNQTYTGVDPRLNIGPKGFTGEKYGGSTYWDTEAYCLNFYLSTREESISKNLLIYRYNQLEKAKENAAKLGLKGALYPMVTMNGEECHNEWEITFEEIHRNAAISYAIYNYVRYTDDEEYLLNYGFEVLVETSRFWASRVNYNPYKDKYMILGVTGPNEYENNVNNNWYTNTMAAWNLEYTITVLNLIKDKYNLQSPELINRLNITEDEICKWEDIIAKMYFPYVESLKIFEQQDGYMDKEQVLAKDVSKKDLPIHQNWSWDRILRSCFIKQGDVLQGLFFLNDKFDQDTIKRNYDFYEARTLHESSLSPCIHSVIASEIGYYEQAYKLYLRTARLDLDNYNNDTYDGLHITSMAGTWMSIIYGFGGMKTKDNTLCFSPFIPYKWNKYSFKILFRGHLIKITITKLEIIVEQEKGLNFLIKIFDKEYSVPCNDRIIINIV